MRVRMDLPRCDRETVMRGNYIGMQRAMARAEGLAKRSFGKPGHLHRRTGRLRASITHSVRRGGGSVMGRLGTNVIYGRIHELGGVIRPVKASALRFRVGGRWVTVRRVTIPARPYLRPALDIDMIAETLRRAITAEAMR